jgi:hypothetical protein
VSPCPSRSTMRRLTLQPPEGAERAASIEIPAWPSDDTRRRGQSGRPAHRVVPRLPISGGAQRETNVMMLRRPDPVGQRANATNRPSGGGQPRPAPACVTLIEYCSYCAALAVFSRIIAIRPCTLPPLRWMMVANSERWVTDMLIPSTMTSLTL